MLGQLVGKRYCSALCCNDTFTGDNRILQQTVSYSRSGVSTEDYIVWHTVMRSAELNSALLRLTTAATTTTTTTARQRCRFVAVRYVSVCVYVALCFGLFTNRR